MKKLITSLAIILSVFLGSLPINTSAQQVTISRDSSTNSNIVIEPPTQNLPDARYGDNAEVAFDIVGAIIAWMIRITAILSIIAITWAGIQIIFGAGDEERMKKGRLMIIYAFVGLVIAGLAYAIVRFFTSIQLNSFF